MAERLKDLEAQFDEASKKGNRVEAIKLAVKIDELKRELATEGREPVTMTLPTVLLLKIDEAAFKENIRAKGQIAARGIWRYFTGRQGLRESLLSERGIALFGQFLAEPNPDKAQAILKHLNNEDLQSCLMLFENEVIRLKAKDLVEVELPPSKVEEIYKTLKTSAESRGIT